VVKPRRNEHRRLEPLVQVSRLRGRLLSLSFLSIPSSLFPFFDVIPLLYNPNSHEPLKERRGIMMKDYYQQSINALQLAGMSKPTQKGYTRSVRRLVKFYGKTPDLITEKELQDYFLHRRNTNKSAAATMRICYESKRGDP
jgi:hypothetical protein